MKEVIFSLAPMGGIMGYVYRNVLAVRYGGIAWFYLSFISPGHTGTDIMKWGQCSILLKDDTGLYLIPQLSTNNTEDFLFTMGVLRDYSYIEFNLNLGCPSGTVMAKKKGSGFLSEREAFRRSFECVSERFPSDMKFDAKTRSGVKDLAEFPAILEIYNDFPFSELIAHSRMWKEFYRRTVHFDAFALVADGTTMSLGYSGGLIDEVNVDRIRERFPSVFHIMFRRGPLRDPVLAMRYLRRLCGEGMPCKEEEKRQCHALYAVLLDGYGKNLLYENVTPYHMKKVWDYLGLAFPEHEGAVQGPEKSRTLSEYEARAKQLSTL